MEHVNKWCSLGESLYRSCAKDRDGKLIPLSVDELLEVGKRMVGKEVWCVHELGERASLSWCVRYNEPLKTKYKIQGVAGVSTGGAHWYTGKNSSWACPLITFDTTSDFVTANGRVLNVSGQITSDNVFVSDEDVSRHFKKMLRNTTEMFNREYGAVANAIGEAKDRFSSLVAWFRENGGALCLKRDEMEGSFASLVHEMNNGCEAMQELVDEAHHDARD